MVEIISWNPKHNKCSDLVLLAATCYSKSEKTQGFSGIYWSRKYMVCGMFKNCKGDAPIRGECDIRKPPNHLHPVTRPLYRIMATLLRASH